MERCPPELHAVILDLACRDSGRTARSLQQVSTYFRAVSAPYAFRALSISGLRQLKGALAQLGASGASARQQPIEHLFLSDRAPQHASADGLALSRAARFEEERERLFRALDDEAEQFARLLPLLLTRAGPTLTALTFLAYSPYHAAHALQLVLTRPLPELRELTLRGSAWEVHPPDEHAPRKPLPGLYPKLERVHLAATRVFTRILRQISASAAPVGSSSPARVASTPSPFPDDVRPAPDAPARSPVTHVRLSGLAKDVRLAARLHAELHARGLAPPALPNLPRRLARSPEIACARTRDWAPVLPAGSALARVVLQPHRLPPLTDCACCSGYFLTEELAHILREIARAQPHLRPADGAAPDAKYAFLPAAREGDVYPYAEALRDWEDRLGGGEGCWADAPAPSEDEGNRLCDDDDEFSGF